MAKVMMTLRLDPEEANLASITRKFKLAPGEIDRDFGVVGLSPEDHLYAILVDEAAGAKLGGVEGVSGPYSNPRIEPFGPPQR